MPKTLEQQREYYKQNRLRLLANSKRYQQKNKRYLLLKSYEWRKRNPLKCYFYTTLGTIKKRCNNPNHDKYKYYGGRGIKCFLSLDDIKLMWNRDDGHLLKRPSIDRTDNNKNYTLENCKFVELSYNIAKDKIGKKYSLELRKKLSDAHKGLNCSKELRLRMSINMKRIWAERKNGLLA